MSAKINGEWKGLSAQHCWDISRKFAAGILKLGISEDLSSVESQEKIIILSPNRPEWILADLAVQMTGAVLTPLYPTMNPKELKFILKETGARIVILADGDIYKRFGEVLKAEPGVEYILSFDQHPEMRHWEDLMTEGEAISESHTDQIKTGTLATIIYTSGTTGDPKGVMLTHKNLCGNMLQCMPYFGFVKPGEAALSFLPLNHVFERMITYLYFHAGLSVYYAEGMETIGANLREVKPVVFTTVPRLLEKVYERIVAAGMELTGIKRKMFFWALNLAKEWDNTKPRGIFYQAQLALADKLVLSKWREALGGNVKAIISGSAPLQERLNRIFTSTGMIVMEGYGLTECSPCVAVNHYESAGRRIGSLGLPLDTVEVKLAEDGEILVKGDNVMQGYYKRPEETAKTFTEDGWFKTGDMAKYIDGNFLKMTDRKKEIFKTSGGKYVAPQVIENKMRESPFVEQIIVVGEGEKFISALIVPAFSTLKKWMKQNNHPIPDSPADLCTLPEVRKLLREQINKYNAEFSQVEKVKKFTLLPKEWTIDTGELTPSLKVKRKVMHEKYATEIADFYAEKEEVEE